ncbi:hypothetical protein B0O99DRAFT_669382 [Bisporella sp. PMI_857]|nr:hypothetical protein B0O99DRAFT_669382 [Bisporella sp. PMI_857]
MEGSRHSFEVGGFSLRLTRVHPSGSTVEYPFGRRFSADILDGSQPCIPQHHESRVLRIQLVNIILITGGGGRIGRVFASNNYASQARTFDGHLDFRRLAHYQHEIVEIRILLLNLGGDLITAVVARHGICGGQGTGGIGSHLTKIVVNG